MTILIISQMLIGRDSSRVNPMAGNVCQVGSASNHAIENETHFVLECSLNNPMRDKFPSILEKHSSKEPQLFLSIKPTSY